MNKTERLQIINRFESGFSLTEYSYTKSSRKKVGHVNCARSFGFNGKKKKNAVVVSTTPLNSSALLSLFTMGLKFLAYGVIPHSKHARNCLLLLFFYVAARHDAEESSFANYIIFGSLFPISFCLIR